MTDPIVPVTQAPPESNHVPLAQVLGAQGNEESLVEEVGRDLEYGYRHKTVASFTVHHGQYQFSFVNHILVIHGENDAVTESMNNAFLEAFHGFEVRDKNAIVKLVSVRNEIPVDEASRTTRGAVGSADIKAPLAGQNIHSAAGQGQPRPNGFKLGNAGQVVRK